MRCPFCGNEETQVKDSRPSEDNAAIRRRRSCPECGQRFTTFERVQLREMTVVKAGNRRQPFDRDKLRGGLERASHKRPVRPEAIDELVNRIEKKAVRDGGQIEAARIGDMCLAGLKRIDQVAYLQFAAVYRQLGVEDVQAELDRLSPPLSRN